MARALDFDRLRELVETVAIARFLEGLVSAETVPDESAQRRILSGLNQHLNDIGLQLRGTGEAHGYPVFQMSSTRAHGLEPRTR